MERHHPCSQAHITEKDVYVILTEIGICFEWMMAVNIEDVQTAYWWLVTRQRVVNAYFKMIAGQQMSLPK